jgi:hypothetical protein
MDFALVLDRLAGHLTPSGHRWALVGGLAVEAHGFVRATQDLDVVTEASAQPTILPFMDSLGYERLHVSAGFSNHAHVDPALGRVDLIYVDAPTADRLFADCRSVPWTGGRTVLVPSPEHLIAMKVHAMKNDASRTFAEMADIQFLMRLPGTDRLRVRHYFETAGLLARYDELLRTL